LVSPAGLKREREVKLPISGFRLSCLQPVGDDRVFVGDAEGHALVELSTGKVLSHSSSDWGRNSALLRGELVLIDRYLRDAAGVKNKFADADAETKAFKALLDSQPADGLAVLPLSGKAKQLRHVSTVAGIASWEDFGEIVVGCRAQGFEVLETSEDLSTITELKRVRTPGSLVRSARVGDLVLGWNGSMTSTDVNVQVLDVKKRSKPRLAEGLWKKTGIAAVQVVGDRLFAAATREKDMFLLTAAHHDGTLSEDQETRVGPGQALAVAVVGDLAVVLGEAGGGAVLRV
jgi:hypothetical protein